MPDPRNQPLGHEEAGIIEGSDEHIDFNDAAIEVGEKEDEQLSLPLQPKEADPVPQQAKPDVQNLQERQAATTLVPALQRERDDLKRQVTERDTQINELKTVRDQITSFGLNPSEAQIGLQLAAGWKLNPAETIKKMLSYAAANGIKVEGQAGVDIDALTAKIEERLAPVLQQAKLAEEQTAKQQEVQRQANEFLTQYPDALIHQESIAQVIRNRNVTPQDAYMQLRIYAAEQGLDWTKPLQPQLLARQEQQQNGQPARTNYSPAPRQTNLNDVRDTELAGDDTSYRSIVDSVLAEYGVSR